MQECGRGRQERSEGRSEGKKDGGKAGTELYSRDSWGSTSGERRGEQKRGKKRRNQSMSAWDRAATAKKKHQLYTVQRCSATSRLGKLKRNRKRARAREAKTNEKGATKEEVDCKRIRQERRARGLLQTTPDTADCQTAKRSLSVCVRELLRCKGHTNRQTYREEDRGRRTQRKREQERPGNKKKKGRKSGLTSCVS